MALPLAFGVAVAVDEADAVDAPDAGGAVAALLEIGSDPVLDHPALFVCHDWLCHESVCQSREPPLDV